MFRQISDAYARVIKLHQEHSNKNFSGRQQEPSFHEFYPEPSDWEKDKTSPTQTIEMVDRKWPDGTKYEGMSLNGKFHGRGIYTYPNGDSYAGEFQFGKIQGCSQSLPAYEYGKVTVIPNWADGQEILTVEGLERNGNLTPLQQAFMEHNAPQCGFCTSGQLMSATALLERNPQPNAGEVRQALAGNLCRCSNYNAIVEAVLAAAETGGA